MKVNPSKKPDNPGYPTARGFRQYGSLVGAAALGLGSLLAGSALAEQLRAPAPRADIGRLRGKVAAEPMPREMGEMRVEPRPAPPPVAPTPAPTLCPATFTNAELRLAVDLAEGSRIVGTPAVTTLPIQTSVGAMALPLDRLVALAFNDDKGGVSAQLANGDRLSGAAKFAELRLTALCGEVNIPAKLIQKIGWVRKGTGGTPALSDFAAAIRQQKLFKVTFDRLAEPLGSIQPSAVLYGRYLEAENAWEVWSPQHPGRPNYHYIYGFPQGRDGRLESAISPTNNTVNLWGPTFSFNENGVVFHPLNPQQAVGKLEVDVKDNSDMIIPPGIDL